MRIAALSVQKCLISVFALLILLTGCTGVEETSKPSMGEEVVKMKTADPTGLCPQMRGTIPAPEPFAGMTNPLPATNENISAGKLLFHEDARPIQCEICHGFKGNGFGAIFQRMTPYPRDFTCYQTMKDVSDGQLFWIIKNGSHGTRMKAFENLEERKVWQLVHYLRHFAD
jgi:mono/diheme cytochrome c family protein